jgi:hypothetical protein
MADDLAVAMGASGRHRVDRAFEAVEGHRTAGIRHLERLIVIVAADIACRHRGSPEMPHSANGRGEGEVQAGTIHNETARQREEERAEGAQGKRLTTKDTKASQRTRRHPSG